MTKILVHILLLFSCLSASAQSIDSLMRLAELEQSETEKAKLLLEISDYWSYTDSTKALRFLNQAKELAEGNDYLEAVSIFYEAGVYFDHDIERSQRLYMKSAELLAKFKTEEAYEYKARLWHNYATLDQVSGNDQSFLDITLKYCIPYAERSGNNILLSGYLSDVGMVFYNHKAYDKSIDYYNQAINLLSKEKNDGGNLPRAYVNMAQSQIYQNELKGAKESLDHAYTLLKDFPESKIFAFYYMVKSMYHRYNKDVEQSLQSINEGIKHATKLHADYDLLGLQYEKYQVYKLEGNYTAAKTQLESILDNKKYSGLTKNKLAFLIELAGVEKMLGDYRRAYELIEEHRLLSDTFHAENTRAKIARMEAMYRTSEQEKEILQLQNKRRIESMLLWGSIFFIILLSCIFYYALRQRKRRNQQQLHSFEQQREIEVAHALMEGEEQERLRLARDLHDGLGGMITGIKMKLDTKARMMEDEDLTKAVEQLDSTLLELRRTARNLIPENLLKYGLEDALKDFCQSLNTEETQITFYCNNLSPIRDKNTQLVLYHIMLELVNNAIRHAEATHILLQCTLEGDLLLIDVEDDGKGFDLETTKRNMGLNNIEMRVAYLEGKMNIESQRGKGTTISIECHI
ncbi:tetratricopeptide repeat-containing sensor histidine kinase [Albibacterium profundi]|uniref:histidine kinase n=1 Tax=Albibacterium profundi TaxID=3134906 RepID=A0ABV5CAP7_9SPHI